MSDNFLSRVEDILTAMINGTEITVAPHQSRVEDLLILLAGVLGGKADLVDGVIPVNELPPIAFADCVIVDDDTERYALTTDDVQNGDVVYVNSSQIMYFVIDDTKLSQSAGYKPLAAGIAAQAVADKNGNDITTTYVKPTSYATQTTGGTAKMWTTVESGETTLNISTQ